MTTTFELEEELKKTREAAYVEGGGITCPHCESEYISGTEISREAGQAIQHVHCNDCGKGWTEVYNLVGIQED